ncbi:MAG: hypothetical protein J6T96_03910 [Bacteroidales bacterium]|nr:hypothetical protein [Bacteroidales bacterium]
MDETTLKNDLESDIDHRLDNLTTIRTMPSRYSFSDNDKEVWIRCSFPIIYAEWEGFFVNAISSYFRKINEIGIPLTQLHPNYFVRNTEKKFSQLLQYPKIFNDRYNFLTNLMNYFRRDENIALETRVNTESNLKFKVLNNILKELNLEVITDCEFEGSSLSDELDKFLLHNRNGIAHGNPSGTITMDEITKAINLVEKLMDLTKESIVNGYKNDCFKKSISS